VSRISQQITSPERALDDLLAWRAEAATGMPWWRKGLRLILRFYKH
jgi:capsular polysaccharide export protein